MVADLWQKQMGFYALSPYGQLLWWYGEVNTERQLIVMFDRRGRFW